MKIKDQDVLKEYFLNQHFTPTDKQRRALNDYFMTNMLKVMEGNYKKDEAGNIFKEEE